MTKKYDANLIVIGAGSGGLVTAYIAAAIKAKVILIEKNAMGGDCLNTGCVPSKSLIASAKFIHEVSNAKNYGIKQAHCEFDFADIMARVHRNIATIQPHDSVERYTALGVDVIHGDAQIISANSVAVNGIEYRAPSIVIAAGAEPFVPPLEGIENIHYYTSDTIWQLKKLPKNMLVVGDGPIGCELAQCFARFGSNVSLVGRNAAIMGREDHEFSDFIAEKFRAEGMSVFTDHTALTFKTNGGINILECRRNNKNGAEKNNDEIIEIEFDTVLIALGRAARLENYGLNKLNIPINSRKTIQTNEYLQAGYANIYAVGDVTGPYQFTHSAAHQAWYAAVNSLFRPFKKFKVDYSVLPWVTYTDPEVARVGLNEKEAKAAGISYEITRYDLGDLDRAITDGHAEGLVKVLTVPGKDKILGATIMGKHAGELIAEFVLAMRYGLGLNKILGTIHAYPTWMEANKYAAGNWKKSHAPKWALSLLRHFHKLRR